MHKYLIGYVLFPVSVFLFVFGRNLINSLRVVKRTRELDEAESAMRNYFGYHNEPLSLTER